MCQVTNIIPKFIIPTRLWNYQKATPAPSPWDVLCGSKSTTQTSQHPKIKITRQIVQYMRHTIGARFMKPSQEHKGKNGGGWALAEEQAVRDMVSHAL